MRNKRKGILMASAILGSAAIVSTGFAAWVVSTNVTETATGNIEVDTVTDERVYIDDFKFVKSGTTAQDVKFGHKSDGSISNPWLTNGTKDAEQLDVSIQFKTYWSDEDRNTNEDDITLYVAFQIYDDEDTKLSVEEFNTLNTYSENGTDYTLVTLPTFTSTVTYSPSKTEDIEITASFGWGSAFGGNNPYTYFNSTGVNGYMASATPTDTEINNAISRLEAIEEKINPLSFKIVVSNKPIA